MKKDLEAKQKQLQDWSLKLQRRVDNAKTEKDLADISVELKQFEEARDQFNWDKQRSETAEKMVKLRGFGNAVGHESEYDTKNVNRPVSPLDIPVAEYRRLHDAIVRKQPYRIDTKHIFGAETKAPFGESSFTSGNLPPVLLPQHTLDLPYDPTDVFAAFRQMPTPEARAVEYIVHTGNASPAAPVAELGVKPDLSPALTTVTQTFTKIAGLITVSNELIWDFSQMMAFMPNEIARAVIDARNNQVLNGNGSGANMLGILNTSGLLSRSVGNDSPLDAVRKGINDLRVGSSFARADLLITHPLTAADLQLQKSTIGTYVLDPSDPARSSDLENVFGCKLITTAYCSPGTMIIADSQWIYAWTRQGLTIETNNVGTDASGTNLWTQNAVSLRAEGRYAIGVARNTAVNILTGLPAS
jgi:HK97 family phage major capsid protein